MADAVATQVLFEDSYKYIAKFTNLSDGTGESAVAKVDVSGLTPASNEVIIEEVWYSVSGMNVTLLWDATTDVRCLELGANTGYLDLRKFGGLPNDAGTGKTGDLLFTTTGHTLGDSYSIILSCRKVRKP